MKFSRNPNGQLEVYTDEGIFLGVLSTMGDFEPEDEDEERRESKDN